MSSQKPIYASAPSLQGWSMQLEMVFRRSSKFHWDRGTWCFFAIVLSMGLLLLEVFVTSWMVARLGTACIDDLQYRVWGWGNYWTKVTLTLSTTSPFHGFSEGERVRPLRLLSVFTATSKCLTVRALCGADRWVDTRKHNIRSVKPVC